MAKLRIFQIAKELNINGYKTRNGNYYNPTTVRRLNKVKTNNCI